MPKPLQETGRITEAAVATAKKTGRLPVQLISPGRGSSGYYPAEVLEQAVADELFPAGTHMYADHPTPTELKERPVRSIKDLMSVTAVPGRIATEEDIASWGAEIGAVVAEVDVLPAYRDVVEHFKGAIGVSIRGDGEINENGEVDGVPMPVVESLAHVKSVDWVTHAGRGGKVLSLVESARATSRAIERGVEEATANDTREALQTALRAAYGSADSVRPRTYVYVRDFDADTVWFEVDGPDNVTSGLFAQSYAAAESGAITLSGQRTEVRVRTTYVPVTRPDSTTPTTEDDQEVTMGKIQIEEAEHTRLTEMAGRVDALQEENATLKAENGTLKEAEARRAREDRAAEIIIAEAKVADVGFTPRECKGFLADITLTESGELDEEKFTTLVKGEAAAKKADSGVGRVRGFGAPVTESGEGKVSLAQIDEALGLGQKGA